MEAIDEDSTAEPASNFNLRLSMTEEKRELSEVSKSFDIGNKGFLTPAERKARSLDHKNEGNLSNEKVVSLIERTEDLKKSNKMLRRYMIALLLVTVTLGVSQIATAIVAARLSKDTSVNSSSGLMTAKDGGKPVVVVSTGQTNVLIGLDDNGNKCVPYSDFVDLFTNAVAGTAQNAIVYTSDGLESLSFSASGTHSNDTHACLGGPDAMCTNYEYCFPEAATEPGTERNLRGRSFFHRAGYNSLGEYCDAWLAGEFSRRLGAVEDQSLRMKETFQRDIALRLLNRDALSHNNPSQHQRKLFELLDPGGSGGDPNPAQVCSGFTCQNRG